MFSAEELAAIRQSLGLTKEALARLLGVGVSSIHRWEREGNSGPSGPALQFYRAARAALDKGYQPEEMLTDRGGDPGVALARIFVLGFLGDK